jgi:hypothetical protein
MPPQKGARTVRRSPHSRLFSCAASSTETMSLVPFYPLEIMSPVPLYLLEVLPLAPFYPLEIVSPVYLHLPEIVSLVPFHFAELISLHPFHLLELLPLVPRVSVTQTKVTGTRLIQSTPKRWDKTQNTKPNSQDQAADNQRRLRRQGRTSLKTHPSELDPHLNAVLGLNGPVKSSAKMDSARVGEALMRVTDFCRSAVIIRVQSGTEQRRESALRVLLLSSCVFKAK